MADEQIAAGWYPDPAGDTTRIRYWDGQAWTEQTQPAVNPDLASSGAGAPAGAPAAPAAPVGTPAAPTTPVAPAGATQGAPAPVFSAEPQPIYAQGQGAAPYAAVEQGKDRKGFAVASLVLGIFSLPCACFAYFAFFPGILAVIFGILGMKSSRRGMAIAGLIMGIVGIIGGIAMTVLVFVTMPDVLQDIMRNPTEYGLPSDAFSGYDF
ncbi:MAG: DUF2510 domain-containing protein [Coriobacteriales bacterium]|jgi:hypothetical protein|nr:DUF2510 domain-containing protein [Coriobacteriales bacterium]